MKIDTNIQSIITQHYLNEMEKSHNYVPCGKRIHSAADDAQGLAISTRIESAEKESIIEQQKRKIELLERKITLMEHKTQLERELTEINHELSKK